MDLSYVWTPVAAMAAELFDFGGEPPGTRTQGPRLKRETILITHPYSPQQVA
jgi:hypothetical protein